MLEYWIRPIYQQLCVDHVAGKLTEYASPIKITLLSGLFGLLTLPALAMNHSLIALFFLLLSGYLDTLDGTVARLSGSVSNLGSVLDIVTDRTVELTVIASFALVNPARLWLCLIMLGSILLCITSFLVVGIFTPNDSSKSFHYSEGLIERPEAFVFFSLMIALPTYFNDLAFLFIILVLYTTLARLFSFYKYETKRGSFFQIK